MELNLTDTTVEVGGGAASIRPALNEEGAGVVYVWVTAGHYSRKPCWRIHGQGLTLMGGKYTDPDQHVACLLYT